jgi:hypothetical protein
MNRLERLTFRHFALPDPNHPPDVPIYRLASLTPRFPSNALDSTFITPTASPCRRFSSNASSGTISAFTPPAGSFATLPDCDELTLSRIHTFDKFFNVLLR